MGGVMETIKLVPVLRFPGFTNEWTSFLLKNVAQFRRGTFPQPYGLAKWYDDENGSPFVQVFDVGDNFKLNPTTKRKISNLAAQKSLFVKQGSLVLTIQGSIGRIAITQYDSYVDRTLLIFESFKKEVDINFYAYVIYLLFEKEKRKAPGGIIKTITKKALSEFKLFIPSIVEQQKIANFLTAIDQRITKLKEKKAAIEDYKKGLMQKIFSQEVRFDAQGRVNAVGAGSAGAAQHDEGSDFPDWEEKRLGDVLTIGSGKDYKHLNEGDIPVYGTGGYMTSVNELLYEGDSVGIGRKGTIDKPMLLSGRFWTVDTLFYTHSFKKVTPFFVYLLFQTINWKKYNEASGVPSLSKTTIEKIKVQIPTVQEQQKIADCLSAIDQSINQLTKQIDQTTQFKKGLLQRMFV